MSCGRFGCNNCCNSFPQLPCFNNFNPCCNTTSTCSSGCSTFSYGGSQVQTISSGNPVTFTGVGSGLSILYNSFPSTNNSNTSVAVVYSSSASTLTFTYTNSASPAPQVTGTVILGSSTSCSLCSVYSVAFC